MLTMLRLQRLKKGMRCLRKFAQGVGLSYGRLSRMELGQEVVPEPYRDKLAQALGLPIGELLDERGLARIVAD